MDGKLDIPCGRGYAAYKPHVTCDDIQLCPHCHACRLLAGTMLGVAERLESGQFASMPTIDHEIDRLRADVARAGIAPDLADLLDDDPGDTP